MGVSLRDSGMGKMKLFTAFLAISAGIFLIVGAGTSFASDNCQQLESLAQQYAGVELTSYQKQVKTKLVVWYKKNCRDHRTAEAN
jgi:hypothetical protein